METENIKRIAEEEYIIMNLDSSQMQFDGQYWNVLNSKNTIGFDEPIPYVTSIELIESYVPNTFYTIESYNNSFTFGTCMESYVINRFNDNEIITGVTVYTLNDGLKEIPNISDTVIREVANMSINTREYTKLLSKQLSTNLYSTFDQVTYNIIHTHAAIYENEQIVGYTVTFFVNDTCEYVLNDFELFQECKRRLVIRNNLGMVVKNETMSLYKSSISLSICSINDYDGDKRFDLYTDSIDDLPTNIRIDVYTDQSIILQSMNYNEKEFINTIQKALHLHIAHIFFKYQNFINQIMPFLQFIDLHLNIELNENKRKINFLSKHDHKFFIDFTDRSSIHKIAGYKQQMYFSHSSDIIDMFSLVADNITTSISANEIRSIVDKKESVIAESTYAIFQIFKSIYFAEKSRNIKGVVNLQDNSIINCNVISTNIKYINGYSFDDNKHVTQIVEDSNITSFGIFLNKTSDLIFPTKKSFFNMLVDKVDSSDNEIIPNIRIIDFDPVNNKFDSLLNDKTFIENIEYTIKAQVIEGDYIYDFSGERYIDLVCVEIQNELKRYNAGYNKLYRYYFDDISELYVKSSKGNLSDIVARQPRNFGPITKLSNITLEFRRSDGNIYDFKSIPFYLTLIIKYLKPKLHTQSV